MKYKFFAADSQPNIDKIVNEWVAKQPTPVTIQLSDTKMTSVKSGAKTVVAITVGVWYS